MAVAMTRPPDPPAARDGDSRGALPSLTAYMNPWRRVLARLDAWDRRLDGLLRRSLAVALIALFLGGLFAILYGWFLVMQPYAE